MSGAHMEDIGSHPRIESLRFPRLPQPRIAGFITAPRRRHCPQAPFHNQSSLTEFVHLAGTSIQLGVPSCRHRAEDFGRRIIPGKSTAGTAAHSRFLHHRQGSFTAGWIQQQPKAALEVQPQPSSHRMPAVVGQSLKLQSGGNPLLPPRGVSWGATLGRHRDPHSRARSH